MQRSLFAFVCAMLAVAFGTTGAFARPLVSLKLTAALIEKSADGTKKLVPLASDALLRPGDEVRYTIVATNAGTDAATHLVPQAKVPRGTAYEAGSASQSDATQIEFSLDGGKTWSARPVVKSQTESGPQEKPADPAAFTTVRWVGSKPLPPKTSLTYSYQVRIK